jgi:hypothetical protein
MFANLISLSVLLFIYHRTKLFVSTAGRRISAQPFQLIIWFILNLKKKRLMVIEQHCIMNWQVCVYTMTVMKPPAWATCLEQVSGHESHILRPQILANWAMCLCSLSPDLVWGGLTRLPMGPPKPPSIAQAQPILTLVLLCVAQYSSVPRARTAHKLMCVIDNEESNSTALFTPQGLCTVKEINVNPNVFHF